MNNKNLIALTLLMLALVSLAGCAAEESSVNEPVRLEDAGLSAEEEAVIVKQAMAILLRDTSAVLDLIHCYGDEVCSSEFVPLDPSLVQERLPADPGIEIISDIHFPS